MLSGKKGLKENLSPSGGRDKNEKKAVFTTCETVFLLKI